MKIFAKRATGFTGSITRALLAGLILAPASVALGAPTTDKQAEEAMYEGIDLFRKGQFSEAEAKYEQAWKLKKTSDIAGNLGTVEVKLGQYRDAAEHLTFSLANLPLTATQKSRAALASQLAEAKKHVGQVTLEVAPEGSEVRVDDARIGNAPLSGPFFVEPGTHRIAATREGSVAEEISVSVQAGEEVAKTLHLSKATTQGAPGQIPTSSASATPNVSPPTSRPVWPWIVGGGVALVGAGVGATLQGVAAGKASTAAQAWRSAGSCPKNPTVNPCLSGKQSNDAANQLKVGSYVAFGVAGAGLAVGAVLYALLPPVTQGPRATRVEPIVAPGFGGLSVSRSF